MTIHNSHSHIQWKKRATYLSRTFSYLSLSRSLSLLLSLFLFFFYFLNFLLLSFWQTSRSWSRCVRGVVRLTFPPSWMASSTVPSPPPPRPHWTGEAGMVSLFVPLFTQSLGQGWWVCSSLCSHSLLGRLPPPIHAFIYLSIHLALKRWQKQLEIPPSVNELVNELVNQSVDQLISQPVILSVCLSACLSVCLSVCPAVLFSDLLCLVECWVTHLPL